MKYLIHLSLFLLAGLFLNSQAFSASYDDEKRRMASEVVQNINVDPGHSLKYARKLELLAESKGDTAFLTFALTLQGTIYNNYLNYAAALEVLEKANALKANDFYILDNLAHTYRLVGKADKSKYYYYKALDADSTKSGQVYGGLGLLHVSNEDFDEAEKALTKALSFAKTKEDSLISYVDFSYMYLQQEDYEKAFSLLTFVEQNKEDFNPNNLSKGFVYAAFNSNLGRYYLEAENAAKAEHYFSKALEIADRLHLGLILEECYKGMERVSVLKNDDAMFQEFWDKHKALQTENQKQLTAFYEYLVAKTESDLQQATEEAQQTKQTLVRQVNLALGSLVVVLIGVIILGISLYNAVKEKANLLDKLEEKSHELENLERQRNRLQEQLMKSSNGKEE